MTLWTTLRHGTSAWPPLRTALLVSLLGAGLLAEGVRWSTAGNAHPPPAAAGVPAQPTQHLTLSKRSSSLIDMPAGAPAAHASALAVLPGDEMLAFWFAGSRESGPDVQIYSSRWTNGDWGPARPVASRESLGDALGFAVRRIGNPAAWVDREGRVNLFVVATGLGGWAASRVVHLVSRDQGASYEVRRVLPMSPLFNTSVLVRTTPVGLPDGGWWLPAHFELGNKYPLIMSFDPDGEPRWIARIGERTTALQPALAAISGREVRAWMRDVSEQRRLQQAVSRDGGATWEDLPALDLSNEDNSVAVLKLRRGGFVLLHNVGSDTRGARNVLRLSVSDDARRWSPAFDVVAGQPGDEYSYPSVQEVGNELHVTYTHQRRAIAHQVFELQYEAGTP
ncbi:sialidase family protein [Ramlibacter sp. AN1015]|uniref:sialidase family protein n=1 Tax=Ramlibacter sp. AN1015 TaxID=3133428 RepID=UPI0030BAA1E5